MASLLVVRVLLRFGALAIPFLSFCTACSDSTETTGAGATGASGGQGGSAAAAGSAGKGGGFNFSGAAGQAGHNSGGSGGKPPVGCGSTVTGTVRDFHAGVDFQCNNSGFTDSWNKDCGPWDPAIVGALGSALGLDRKPVYAASSKTPSTTSPTNFAQWYSDAPGVNLSEELKLTLTAGVSGTFSYETPFFFPLDNKLFAAEPTDPDQGKYVSDDQKVRNFHFTYELHTTFRYQPGNVFRFRGDDDVFVYIADKLAVNLGGIHVPLQAQLNLDTGRLEIVVEEQWESLVKLHAVSELGFPDTIERGVAGTVPLALVAGEVYNFDFFFAERNCCASNFRVETNLEFVDCGTGPLK